MPGSVLEGMDFFLMLTVREFKALSWEDQIQQKVTTVTVGNKTRT